MVSGAGAGSVAGTMDHLGLPMLSLPALDLPALAEQFTLEPRQFIGIPIAIVGAVLLSLGAQLQHRGVTKVEVHDGRDGSRALGVGQFWRLLKRPS